MSSSFFKKVCSFFKKVVSLEAKRKAKEDNQPHPVNARGGEILREHLVPHDFDVQRHGLFVLHPTAKVHVEPEEIGVDIVAIHGLNGSAKKTWTDPDTGNFWLKDQLPGAIPTSRIMTFGYGSGLAFSNSRSDIDDFSRDLLNRLWVARNSYEARNRRLVFVAHSFGGIVVKKVNTMGKRSAEDINAISCLLADQRLFVAQALVMAHENVDRFGPILRSTVGIAFMGTPHRGSEMVKWTALLTKIINIASFGQGIRKPLLENLDADSVVLTEISRQFAFRAQPPMKIISFVEQQVKWPLAKLVVSKHSAVLGLHNEVIIPLNAHHRSMCRFRSSGDQNYILVEAAIKELAFGCMEACRPLACAPAYPFYPRDRQTRLLSTHNNHNPVTLPALQGGLWAACTANKARAKWIWMMIMIMMMIVFYTYGWVWWLAVQACSRRFRRRGASLARTCG